MTLHQAVAVVREVSKTVLLFKHTAIFDAGLRYSIPGGRQTEYPVRWFLAGTYRCLSFRETWAAGVLLRGTVIHKSDQGMAPGDVTWQNIEVPGYGDILEVRIRGNGRGLW